MRNAQYQGQAFLLLGTFEPYCSGVYDDGVGGVTMHTPLENWRQAQLQTWNSDDPHITPQIPNKTPQIPWHVGPLHRGTPWTGERV